MDATERGTVKWFNDAKGFGFINHTSGKDVFVHYSVIQADGFKTLKDGEVVEYELHDGPKGFNASKVFRIAPPQEAAGQQEASEQKATKSLKDSIEITREDNTPADNEELRVSETKVAEVTGDDISLSSELSESEDQNEELTY